MSVIADLRFPTDAFELGRILTVEAEATFELETMVPLGQKAVPFLWVYDHDQEAFEAAVSKHPSVDALRTMDEHEHRTLYALDWLSTQDVLFTGFREANAQLLNATGSQAEWDFEVRVPSHEALTAFQTYCRNADLPVEVRRIYNPTKPGTGPYYGLTEPQREALLVAFREGYYAIPRETSTRELGEIMGISDQAVTERLRRATVTLVTNTLAATGET